MRLHLRGRGLPDGEPVEWWVVDGVLSAERVPYADTVFEGGWILPGLVVPTAQKVNTAASMDTFASAAFMA